MPDWTLDLSVLSKVGLRNIIFLQFQVTMVDLRLKRLELPEDDKNLEIVLLKILRA